MTPALALLVAAAHPAAPPPVAPGSLRVALVNLKSGYSDGPDPAANRAAVRRNLARHLLYADRAAAAGAEFVGFPELSLNGYHFSQHMTWLRLDGDEVKALRRKAVEKRVTIAAGLAEEDAAGKRWNTHVLIGPDGRIVGAHHKIYLTKEKGFVEAGSRHDVFPVKGFRVGVLTCADGSDRENLRALRRNGAELLYAPHANTTGGTSAGWYRFRAPWAGADGWVAALGVPAALHNHAGLYDPSADPPPGADANAGWAGGAWVLGRDGRTLAQVKPSASRADSRECVLVHDVPVR